MTGYPIQNNLMEYYCMVDFVRPNYLGTKKEFANMFDRPIRNGQCIDSTTADVKYARQKTHVLVELLKGFVQRLEIGDIFQRSHHLLKRILPENLEYVLLLRKSPIQHELYRCFVVYCQSEIENRETLFNPLTAFAACCKIWNHPDILYKVLQSRRASALISTSKPADFDDLDSGDFLVETTARNNNSKCTEPLSVHNSISYEWAEVSMTNYEPDILENGFKLAIAIDIIDETVQLGEKVLLFSQSLYTLDLIERYLESQSRITLPNGTVREWRRNRTFFRFDGSTNATERERLIARFNNEHEPVHLFLISTRAGSLGINLVAASRVIIFDVSWNPCHDAQAVCRIYRYGQKKPTYIYRLITDNSMERAIFNRQIGKHGLSQRVVDDHQIDANVTRREIAQLLLYEEHLDMISSEWDVDSWTIKDALLKKVCKRTMGRMLAQEPFLHETLLLESDESLSEQEKQEARLLYEREKSGRLQDNVGNDRMYQQVAQHGNFIGFSRSGGLMSMVPSYTMPTSFDSKPMATVRPLCPTPMPMTIRRMDSDPQQSSSPRFSCRYPPPQIPIDTHSTDEGHVESIFTDQEMSLPSVSFRGQNFTVGPFQTAMLVRPIRGGTYLRLPDGHILDAKGTKYDEKHHESPSFTRPVSNIDVNSISNEVIDLCDDSD